MRARPRAAAAAALATTALLAISAGAAFARDGGGGPKHAPHTTEHAKPADAKPPDAGGSGHDTPAPSPAPSGPMSSPRAPATSDHHVSFPSIPGERHQASKHVDVKSKNDSGTQALSESTLAEAAAVAAGGYAPTPATAAPPLPAPLPQVDLLGTSVSQTSVPHLPTASVALPSSTPVTGAAAAPSPTPTIGAAAPDVVTAASPAPVEASAVAPAAASAAPAAPVRPTGALPDFSKIASLVPAANAKLPSPARGVLDTPAGRSLTAVFALLVGIGVFLLAHRRVASDDPKLAAANVEHDLARFR
jgi:hypothetical protein